MGLRLRVGITQRQVVLMERDETRDAVDAQLPRLIWEAGFTPVAVANEVGDADAYLEALALDAFVLSGGDDVGFPPKRDIIERAILTLSARTHAPVLGICRGMQVIVTFCGGTLASADGHVATRHAVSGRLGPARDVNSYHELVVSTCGLPHGLEAIAHAPDGTIEAVRHQEFPWTAIMWHPERESPFRQADITLTARALALRGNP